VCSSTTSCYSGYLTDISLSVSVGALLATSSLVKSSICPVTQVIAHSVGAIARILFAGHFPGMGKRKVTCVTWSLAFGCEFVTMVFLAVLSGPVGGFSARLLWQALQALTIAAVGASFQILLGVVASRAFDCAALDEEKATLERQLQGVKKLGKKFLSQYYGEAGQSRIDLRRALYEELEASDHKEFLLGIARYARRVLEWLRSECELLLTSCKESLSAFSEEKFSVLSDYETVGKDWLIAKHNSINSINEKLLRVFRFVEGSTMFQEESLSWIEDWIKKFNLTEPMANFKNIQQYLKDVHLLERGRFIKTFKDWEAFVNIHSVAALEQPSVLMDKLVSDEGLKEARKKLEEVETSLSSVIEYLESFRSRFGVEFKKISFEIDTCLDRVVKGINSCQEDKDSWSMLEKMDLAIEGIDKFFKYVEDIKRKTESEKDKLVEAVNSTNSPESMRKKFGEFAEYIKGEFNMVPDNFEKTAGCEAMSRVFEKIGDWLTGLPLLRSKVDVEYFKKTIVSEAVALSFLTDEGNEKYPEECRAIIIGKLDELLSMGQGVLSLHTEWCEKRLALLEKLRAEYSQLTESTESVDDKVLKEKLEVELSFEKACY